MITAAQIIRTRPCRPRLARRAGTAFRFADYHDPAPHGLRQPARHQRGPHRPGQRLRHARPPRHGDRQLRARRRAGAQGQHGQRLGRATASSARRRAAHERRPRRAAQRVQPRRRPDRRTSCRSGSSPNVRGIEPELRAEALRRRRQARHAAPGRLARRPRRLGDASTPMRRSAADACSTVRETIERELDPTRKAYVQRRSRQRRRQRPTASRRAMPRR